jgi:hypothetical protein
MKLVFSLIALPFKIIAMIFHVSEKTAQDIAVLGDLASKHDVKITYYKGM